MLIGLVGKFLYSFYKKDLTYLNVFDIIKISISDLVSATASATYIWCQLPQCYIYLVSATASATYIWCQLPQVLHNQNPTHNY